MTDRPIWKSARRIHSLRGLGIYHGKRGYGVSVEFDVKPGPVTTFGIGQDRDGSYVFIASEGEVVPGPLLQIGNTTSRVTSAVILANGWTPGAQAVSIITGR
jgi:L-arabinose isomerase